jgi:hypothetical protein
MRVRLIGIIAGTWLLASAFIWRHSPFQKVNAILCGLLAIGIGILDLYASRARALVAVLALWIFLSAVFSFSINDMTLWSNGACAVAIVLGVDASGPKRAASS